MHNQLFAEPHAGLPAGVGIARNKSDLALPHAEAVGDNLFFIAASAVMLKLRAQAEHFAQLDLPILIIGESGSGKHTLARLIHELSRRAEFPFLKVNCAALAGDLLESELFGQQANAAGETTSRKPGKLELCARGTILLEDIGAIPVGTQPKLLQVLQDKEFYQAGHAGPIRVDARILTLADPSFVRAQMTKQMRNRLHYLLSAFTLQVPPLRERKDDIPTLMCHFMQHMADTYGFPPRTFSEDAIRRCQAHSWPGNVRELENFVRSYLIVGDEALSLADVAGWSHHESDGLEQLRAEPGELGLKSLVDSVQGETERKVIAAALDRTYWNRKAAARLLKISYRTLLYKLEKHHMRPH